MLVALAFFLIADGAIHILKDDKPAQITIGDSMYEYRARVIRVVDADTFHLDVDMGMDIHTHKTIRLNGVDAYEKNSPKGKDAIQLVHDLIKPGDMVTLLTYKDKREKFGRYLGEIYTQRGVNVGVELLDAQLAVPYTGGTR